MRIIQCNNHKIKFFIPTEEQEFLSGKYHDDVNGCHLHHEEFPSCVFEEVEEP